MTEYKMSRAMVNEDIINEYFDKLEVTMSGVAPNIILNYDETNITDDPGQKKVVVRRGSRHPERIIDFIKLSISVMFTAVADDTFLPPFITYMRENLYNTWTENSLKRIEFKKWVVYS